VFVSRSGSERPSWEGAPAGEDDGVDRRGVDVQQQDISNMRA
jgi:hypothetical protein